MKKGVKALLIVAGSLAAVGIICVAVAVGVRVGRSQSDGNKGDTAGGSTVTPGGSPGGSQQGQGGTSGGAVGDLGGDTYTQDVSSVRGVDVEIGKGNLTVSYADVAAITVNQDSSNKYRCYVEEGELHVDGGSGLGGGGQVSVQIPQGTVLGKLDIEIGSGSAAVDAISVNSLSVDVESGSAVLTGVDAGNISADASRGTVTMQLAGAAADYRYDAECEGSGSITVGADVISGRARRSGGANGASKYLELDAESGKIEITFAQ